MPLNDQSSVLLLKLQQAESEVQRLKLLIHHLLSTLKASGIHLPDPKTTTVMLGSPWTTLINTGQAEGNALVSAMNLFEALRANLASKSDVPSLHPRPMQSIGTIDPEEVKVLRNDAACSSYQF